MEELSCQMTHLNWKCVKRKRRKERKKKKMVVVSIIKIKFDLPQTLCLSFSRNKFLLMECRYGLSRKGIFSST
jgi:hypothetical protein